VNLAFVLLADGRLPKGSDITKAFSAVARGSERLVSAADRSSEAKGVIQFELTPGGVAMVALMPGPVPDEEADQASRFSVSALGTGWKLPQHKAHLVVMLQAPDSTPPSRDVLSAFTSFVAAVTKASGSVGVYWGEAGATHDPKFFVGISQEREIGPRMMLWTGLSMGSEPGGRISLLSLGMKQLGLPDLMLVARQSEGNGALGTFFDLLGYLAQIGRPLSEGETVGRTDVERLPVSYVPSPINAAVKVWRVELP
jgi:Domain of unknown function (DUF4261)